MEQNQTQNPFVATPYAEVLSGSMALAGNLADNTSQLVLDIVDDSQQVAQDAVKAWDATMRAAEASKELWASVPRIKRIVADAGSIIARYRWLQVRSRFIAHDKAADAWEQLHTESANKLYQMCIELQGGVLKLGQLLSSRMDVLPQPYVEKLSLLQDRAPFEEAEVLVAMIEEELGQPLDQLFATFDMEPIAAASLAQVHSATLPDGTHVAVKIQRPGIEAILDADIKAMHIVARMVEMVLPQVSSQSYLLEIVRTLREEVEFDKELISLERFRADAAGSALVIPQGYASHSSPSILTAAFIEGGRLTDYLNACRDQGETGQQKIDDLFATMLQSFCRQILHDGHFHADPHPGNFMVSDDEELVLLDFGCVQEFPDEIRHKYITLCVAAIGRNMEEVNRLLLDMGFRTQHQDPEVMGRYAMLFLEEFLGSGDIDFGAIDASDKMADAIALTKENPVVEIPPEFVMLGRVFLSISGLFMTYNPRINMQEIIMPYLMQAMAAK